MNVAKIHPHVDKILPLPMAQAPTSAAAFPTSDQIQKDPRHMATSVAKVMSQCLGKGAALRFTCKTFSFLLTDFSAYFYLPYAVYSSYLLLYGFLGPRTSKLLSGFWIKYAFFFRQCFM